MGQTEVLEFLKTCQEPKTRKQIADAMQEDVIKVSHALQKLIKAKDIDFIEYNGEESGKLVGYLLTRRTRFYFILE